MDTEEIIVKHLIDGKLSPRAAAFFMHALIEMVAFDDEDKKKFQADIIEIFMRFPS